ncbi:hypothetical protein J3E64_004122 [Sphingobium sp. OAS761]|uniref:hypothetical protein n=1 Tax=Sphingobium sp. OAS761 TaxID=2817901 RepID=UPI0020A04779|nr:hypothetical protein [Sphingobium sp. OAS761]MCP1472404.1 hypothetical protein [Sphingobium sp. OAS761]
MPDVVATQDGLSTTIGAGWTAIDVTETQGTSDLAVYHPVDDALLILPTVGPRSLSGLSGDSDRFHTFFERR